MGCLETKKVGEDLSVAKDSEQIDRYRSLSENIILSDYLDFVWIYKGEVQSSVSLCQKADLDLTKEILVPEKTKEDFFKMIVSFFNQKESLITKAHELAQKLALPTRYLKEELLTILEISPEDTYIQNLYQSFKKYFNEELSSHEFADAFAQTFSYSLFLTKINLEEKSTLLNTDNIRKYTPKSFELLKGIVDYISKLEEESLGFYIKPYIDSLLSIINNIEIESIKKDLTFTEKHEKDPYLFFYEDFLRIYDKKISVQAGVYYTPEPIVKSIVKNLNKIIEDIFQKEEGLSHKEVKILDFACGTGNFLLETYKLILEKNTVTKVTRKSIIQNHILKNIYGLELLIPAYSVSHLKLSEYLKEIAGYKIGENNPSERLPIYLTNTLNMKEKEADLFNFIPELSKEGKLAEEVKRSKNILVIMGNPPYNANSQNKSKFIEDLLLPYFPNPSPKEVKRLTGSLLGLIKINESEYLYDNIKERNPKWLNDDYVKFIRFSEYKIQQAREGAIGIITNHSFMDNPTFRAMRYHLLNTFDQIYIIDLHGNSKKKETSLDGSPDKNIFDIQQGVSISFFIKKEGLEKGVFHKDIYGTREAKLEEVEKLSIFQKEDFTQINPQSPFYLFKPQNEELTQEYNQFISLKEIFKENNVGIVTGKDSLFIQKSKKDLIKEIKKEFNSCDESLIKEINYRPFDTREIYYEPNFLERSRSKIMKHLLDKENMGLVYSRQVKEKNFNHSFISNKLINYRITISASGGAYFSPLYLYSDSGEKTPNFSDSFWENLQSKFSSPTPEEVLGYIYAILYTPSYRLKYKELLKIDFPKVPFEVEENFFKEMATLGNELIEAHLLEKINIDKTIGLPDFETEKENFIMEKISYNTEVERLYVNSSLFFGKVSPDVWAFYIGGYQVLEKYLKERKGENLIGEIEHIQNVIRSLTFSINQMKKMDEAYNTYFSQ